MDKYSLACAELLQRIKTGCWHLDGGIFVSCVHCIRAVLGIAPCQSDTMCIVQYFTRAYRAPKSGRILMFVSKRTKMML